MRTAGSNRLWGELRAVSFAPGKGRGLYNRLGRAGRHHADDLLVESEYRSVCLKLFSRYAERAHQGATVAGDHLRGTAVVVENAPKSLSRHDGASVIRACRQRCEELSGRDTLDVWRERIFPRMRSDSDYWREGGGASRLNLSTAHVPPR